VKPDPICRFEGKAGVYRKSGAILFVKRYAAIAAVVALGIVVAIYSTRKEEFSMEDLPVTVVKTETILLPEPEAIVEPEIERVQFMNGRKRPRGRGTGDSAGCYRVEKATEGSRGDHGPATERDSDFPVRGTSIPGIGERTTRTRVSFDYPVGKVR
ncbi:MAG: hypothetical protein ACLUDU_15835, partial [Butyricimonas faecihominis]